MPIARNSTSCSATAMSGDLGRSAATASALTSTISSVTNTTPQPNATAATRLPRASDAMPARNQTKKGADSAISAQPTWICVRASTLNAATAAAGASKAGRSPITAAPATNSATASAPLALSRLLPRPEQRQRVLHALQLLPAGERPVERVLRLVVHRLGREHAPRPRHAGQPRRHVHRPPVPVAAAADRLAARDTRAQHREVLALVLGRAHEVERHLHERLGVGRHEHRG